MTTVKRLLMLFMAYCLPAELALNGQCEIAVFNALGNCFHACAVLFNYAV